MPASMIQHVRSAFSRLTDALGAEQERWPLWLPVFLGVGIGVYFGLPREPPGWLGLAVLAVAVAATIAARKRPIGLLAGIALSLAAAGFAMAQGRTALMDAPVLARKTPPVLVEGRIAEIESKTNGYRVVLDHVRIEGQARAAMPERVRIRVRDPDGVLKPGGWISVRAILSPPPPPATPGGYDFQRQAYFQGIGAVGFAVAKRPQSLAPPAERGWSPVVWLDGVRADVTRRVMAASGGGAAGAIAAALLTGQQGAIPDDVLQAMRDSGLAHLLAISGQNISIMAGFVFLLVRGLLALIPPVALRHPIKKWAAACGFASALFYLLLSGAGVPTQRSVAMIGLVLLAIILDRSVISMRPLAWAALFILLILPEAMMGPSFQLSFAAVAALIAAYEALPGGYGAWVRGSEGSAGWFTRAGRHLLAVALTSVIAIAATTPFAAYHFNRFSLYGLVANMIAVPLTDLWIMPWALAVLALMPFGLERWALEPMVWGVQVMIDVAREVASWPSAVIAMPTMPTSALVLITLGGLWLFIWRRRVRLLGSGADRNRHPSVGARASAGHPGLGRRQARGFTRAHGRSGRVERGRRQVRDRALAVASGRGRGAALACARCRGRRWLARLRHAGLPLPPAGPCGRAGATGGCVGRGLRGRRTGRQPGASAPRLRRDTGDRPLRPLAQRHPCDLAGGAGPAHRNRARPPRRPALGAAPGTRKENGAARGRGAVG